MPEEKKLSEARAHFAQLQPALLVEQNLGASAVASAIVFYLGDHGSNQTRCNAPPKRHEREVINGHCPRPLQV